MRCSVAPCRQHACTLPANRAWSAVNTPTGFTARDAHPAQLHSGRPQPGRLAAQPAVVEADPDPTTAAAPQLWAAFAECASGEWDGVTVTFDRDGEAQQLPEYYVPQAYRDWEVKLHDWQSQCSMLADGAGMRYSLRRLMPTVGCEADAIAFVEEQQQMFSAAHSAHSAIAADGGYSHGPDGDLSSPELFEAAAEHCLPLAPGQRLRVVHRLKRMGAAAQWTLLSIELHRERRDGPHTGRRELAGCGGGMDLFSQQAPLAAEAVEGRWIADGEQLETGGGDAQRMQVSGREWSAAALPGLVRLPLGAWSWAEVSGSGVALAAGVVLGDGAMRVSRREVGGGRVQAELLTLRRE